MLSDTTFPFRVNRTIKDQIGVRGLRELGAHLWPVDCQTCGRPFDGEVPTLVVVNVTVIALASLHHAGCRAPEWQEGVVLRNHGDHLSYRTLTSLLPTEVNGAPDPLPLMLVNPSLEQVGLHPTDSGWSVATMMHYREQCGLTGISARDPVPDAHAWMRPDGILTVTLERTHESWEFDTSAPPGLREKILQRSGVGIGVTTAYIPTEHFTTVADFMRAMQSGQMALGWIALHK